MPSNKRKDPRYKVSLPIQVETAKGKELCKLVDISASGCLVKSRQQLNPAAQVTLQFYIQKEETGEYSAQQPIHAKSVYRSKANEEGIIRYGFEFIGLAGNHSGVPQIIEEAVSVVNSLKED